MKKRIFQKTTFYILIAALCILFLYKCPYSYLFGICCPGCGMTRAFWALLHLDLQGAFHYHPLFGVVIAAVLGWMGEQLGLLHFSNRQKSAAFWIGCAAFLIVYVIRLLSGSDVVFIDFENSLIYRLYQALRT